MNQEPTLQQLRLLGEDLLHAEVEVLRLTARLKQAKAARDLISKTAVPEMLAEVGMKSIELLDGEKIEIKDILSVTPPKANRPKVIEHLIEKGEGGMIKTTVSIPFKVGEESDIKELILLLGEEGYACNQDTKVESSTLRSWVKKRLDEGLPVDTDLFGVYQAKEAHFTNNAPKEPIFDGE